MQEYPLGTVEYFVVDVTDRLANLATLDGYALTFDIVERATGTAKYTNASATNDVMRIKCLVDTTGWDAGIYQLWTTIHATPESPRLGPFEFRVVD